jgi:protein SCO1
MRTILCALVILCLGSAALWAGTDGLRALTAEQARRLAVQNAPRSLPAAMLEDQNGDAFSLAGYRGRRLLIDFIYTRCRSVCSTLGATFQRLSGQIAERGPNGPVLLSISFDPDTDTAPTLKAYAELYHADGKLWRIARVADKKALAKLLRAFEVVVIPDALGDFQHNAAIHLVDEHGQLTGIFGYDEAELAGDAVASSEQ